MQRLVFSSVSGLRVGCVAKVVRVQSYMYTVHACTPHRLAVEEIGGVVSRSSEPHIKDSAAQVCLSSKFAVTDPYPRFLWRMPAYVGSSAIWLLLHALVFIVKIFSSHAVQDIGQDCEDVRADEKDFVLNDSGLPYSRSLNLLIVKYLQRKAADQKGSWKASRLQ